MVKRSPHGEKVVKNRPHIAKKNRDFPGRGASAYSAPPPLRATMYDIARHGIVYGNDL